MAQARATACFMFIQEQASRRELQALGSLPPSAKPAARMLPQLPPPGGDRQPW